MEEKRDQTCLMWGLVRGIGACDCVIVKLRWFEYHVPEISNNFMQNSFKCDIPLSR